MPPLEPARDFADSQLDAVLTNRINRQGHERAIPDDGQGLHAVEDDRDQELR